MSKTAIIYWSGTGNTGAMAKAIASGMKEKGTEVETYEVADASAVNLADYSKIAFGCPSMGVEVLEETEFDPYFTSIENTIEGKKIALFGSYGWGDGEWMRNWVERVKNDNAILFGDGLIMQESPDNDQCSEYGKQFADF